MQDAHVKGELKERGKTVPPQAFSEGKPILEPSAGCEGTIGETISLKTVYGNKQLVLKLNCAVLFQIPFTLPSHLNLFFFQCKIPLL